MTRTFCEKHRRWHDSSAPCPVCASRPTVTQKLVRMVRGGYDRMRRGGRNR